MKTDLKDVTFMILVRLDSIERLENMVAVANSFVKYFNTHISVVEASAYNNGVLQRMLKKEVAYTFVEDKDPVLHKTMYYNRMALEADTPFLAIWDADTVVDKEAILKSVSELRDGNADVAFPYNGYFLETSDILRNYYLKKKDIKTLYRHQNKLMLLYDFPVVGGAVLFSKEKYISIGMDNEKHYGWGNDDYDRFYRFRNFGYNIYNTDNYLFHLSHPRGINSFFRSNNQKNISTDELTRTEHSSKAEILQEFSARTADIARADL
jgi:hypothetical protein